MTTTENLRARLAAAVAQYEEEQAAARAATGPWSEAFDLDDGRDIVVNADTTVKITIGGTPYDLTSHDAEEIGEALLAAAAVARHRANQPGEPTP
jgi:hypothetical protein